MTAVLLILAGSILWVAGIALWFTPQLTDDDTRGLSDDERTDHQIIAEHQAGHFGNPWA